MAEVLGIVASGIAIAEVVGHATKTIQKLKEFRDSIKNIPQSIENLMNQLDCLAPLLREAERQASRSGHVSEPIDLETQRCVEEVRKAWDNLSDFVDDVSAKLKSKNWFYRKLESVLFVMKRDQLKTLEWRLESAIRVLQLAIQINFM